MSLKPKPRLNFNIDQLDQLVYLAQSLGLKELHIRDSKVYQCIPEISKDKNFPSHLPLLVIDLQSTLGPCINFHVDVKKLAKLVGISKKAKEQNIVIEENANGYKLINREASVPAITLPDVELAKISTKQTPVVYELNITKEDFNYVCEPFCLKKEKIIEIKKLQKQTKEPIKKGQIRTDANAIEFLIYGLKLKALGFGDDDNPNNNQRPNNYMVTIPPIGVFLTPDKDSSPDLILRSYYSAPVHFKRDATICDATIKLLLQHSRQQYWMFTQINMKGIDLLIIEPLKMIFKQQRMRSDEEIMSTLQKLTEGQ